MWLYYNTSRQENTICPHGQVARQGDGFDIILALDKGSLVSGGYSSISLYYQRSDQATPSLFKQIEIDEDDIEQLVFTKLNDSEITYGLVNGTKYDTVTFTIDPTDDIVLKKGDLSIQFWRSTTSQPVETLFSKTSLYLEQSLNYFDTISNKITKSEAKKILNLIENGVYIVTGSWAQASTFAASDFSLNMKSSHGVTTLYGNFTATNATTGSVLVATTPSTNRTLPASSVVHCLKSDGTVINGRVIENGSNLEFWVDGNLSANESISVNGVLYIQFGSIYSETTIAQYPYVNRNGDANLAGDFVPLNDGEIALGSSLKKFSDIYVEEINGQSADSLEHSTNKVTSISSSSTDSQYPSAKCVYDNKTRIYLHKVVIATEEHDEYYFRFYSSNNTPINTFDKIYEMRANLPSVWEMYVDTQNDSYLSLWMYINSTAIGLKQYIGSSVSTVTLQSSDIAYIQDTAVEI